MPSIESALQQNQAEFNFDIIHLMGTHFNYDRRYPKEFAKFSAKDIDFPPYATDKEKEMIATYANAVAYNDYIINEIFKIYSKEEAIILYISDHGESLYEHKGKLGHFFTSKWTAEIPFVILMTEKFIRNHDKLVQKLESAKNKPFMSDDLIHLLCGIAQIGVEDYKTTKDPMTNDFDSTRVRIFNQKADYDKTLKEEKAQPQS